MNSMTGFGRGEHNSSTLSATVEISSVNRKQADIQITLPRNLSELETELRKYLQQSISRGRLSATITLKLAGSTEGALQIDPEKARALESAFTSLSDELGRTITATAADFLAVPGMLSSADNSIDSSEALSVIQPALEQALQNLLSMRNAEGQELQSDLSSRLQLLEAEAASISEIAPEVVTRYRETLNKRLSEIGLGIDLNDERILREIALFAERTDISEELTRLTAHFLRFREIMQSTEAVGRPLDFLCQEINREFNTIGSKANNSGIAQHVVAAKTELEKIREQVQNIE